MTIFEVRYQGNDGCTLCMDPRFRSRENAQNYANRQRGCGLTYGAYVEEREITEEEAAKMLRLLD